MCNEQPLRSDVLRSALRDEIIQTCDVIVIKVGTNVLTHPNGLLYEERIQELTAAIADIKKRGKKVVLVSSGAIGAGMGRLALTKRPTELPELQAVAAIGQCALMEVYERSLRQLGCHAAQILMTADDFSHRQRYLNASNTLRHLLQYDQVLPIINENDTISVEELNMTFGDNDKLAALIASHFECPLLILLTDVQGLYDRSPDDPESQFIPFVETWTPTLTSLVAEKKSSRSKGGMMSKIRAAKTITESGGHVIIASGDIPGTLEKLLNAEEVGTLFLSQGTFLRAKKRWIGFAVPPAGTLTLDSGAVKAVLEGKSLLPIGVLRCHGTFERGAVVALTTITGQEIARGLINYCDTDVAQILGKKSNELPAILGECRYSELIHCDHICIDV